MTVLTRSALPTICVSVGATEPSDEGANVPVAETMLTCARAAAAADASTCCWPVKKATSSAYICGVGHDEKHTHSPFCWYTQSSVVALKRMRFESIRLNCSPSCAQLACDVSTTPLAWMRFSGSTGMVVPSHTLTVCDVLKISWSVWLFCFEEEEGRKRKCQSRKMLWVRKSGK